MASKFTLAVLASVELPQPVLLDLIPVSTTFRRTLAKNRYLGPAAAPLIRAENLPAASLIDLIKTGNIYALDAFLETKENRYTPLSAVQQYWRLSPKDQLRFANMELPNDICARMLRSRNTCTTAKLILVDKLASRFSPPAYVPERSNDPEPIPESHLYTRLWPAGGHTNYRDRELLMHLSLSHLGDLVLVMDEMGPNLRKFLGDGLDSVSARAWPLFLQRVSCFEHTRSP